MNILLSPHSDDETWYASYIMLKYKPLIITVTEDTVQSARMNRPEHWLTRKTESVKAAHYFGLPLMFMSIKESELTEERLMEFLPLLKAADKVFAPDWFCVQPHHNIVGRFARKNLDNVLFFPTYNADNQTIPKGTVVEEFVPTEEMRTKKREAADYHESQKHINRGMYDQVLKNNEWLCDISRDLL